MYKDKKNIFLQEKTLHSSPFTCESSFAKHAHQKSSLASLASLASSTCMTTEKIPSIKDGGCQFVKGNSIRK